MGNCFRGGAQEDRAPQHRKKLQQDPQRTDLSIQEPDGFIGCASKPKVARKLFSDSSKKETGGYRATHQTQQELTQRGTDEGANLSEDSFAISTGEIQRSPCLPGAKSSRGLVRIASWNLQCFDDRKAEETEVLEVMCRTIVSHG